MQLGKWRRRGRRGRRRRRRRRRCRRDNNCFGICINPNEIIRAKVTLGPDDHLKRPDEPRTAGQRDRRHKISVINGSLPVNLVHSRPAATREFSSSCANLKPFVCRSNLSDSSLCLRRKIETTLHEPFWANFRPTKGRRRNICIVS